MFSPIIKEWYDYLILIKRNSFKINPFFMLRWAVIFLVIAIIAAIFGFGGIAAGAETMAKVLFFIFIVLFLLSLISGKRNTSD